MTSVNKDYIDDGISAIIRKTSIFGFNGKLPES